MKQQGMQMIKLGTDIGSRASKSGEGMGQWWDSEAQIIYRLFHLYPVCAKSLKHKP